jgi:hypothetical protein
MKRTFAFGFATVLLAYPMMVSMAFADAATATEGLTSTKDHGVVSVMSDPTLANGRLVLKVVAKNGGQAAASFGPENVKVFTAAGTPVKLVSLDQLVQEVTAAAGSADTMVHAPTVHSGPIMGHDAGGRPDLSRYTGGNDAMNGMDANQARSASRKSVKDDPKLQEQIANLNAAILHDLTIAPAAVAGGQIVTEKLKFARKEAHDLHVAVEFNGERHEFDFTAPPPQ